ncbi:MAG: nuclear transport factor 2 family protein [Actinomycetota bacterium]
MGSGEVSAVDVVTSYLRSFSGNDPAAIAAHVADGFRNEHQSALGSGCVGRDEYHRRLPHFLGAFTDRAYSVEDLVEQRRDAVTDVVVRYHFEADYEGQKVKIPGTMWFSVRDGRITRRVDTWDSLTFLQQTDQAPTPAT